jgi:molybdenum cofactor biosynthesis enzyme MoaA
MKDLLSQLIRTKKSKFHLRHRRQSCLKAGVIVTNSKFFPVWGMRVKFTPAFCSDCRSLKAVNHRNLAECFAKADSHH